MSDDGDPRLDLVARCGDSDMRLTWGGMNAAHLVAITDSLARCIDALERRIRELESAQFRPLAGQVPEGRETD